MSRFTTHLIIEPSLDETTATLFKSLVYQSDLIGEIVVPVGFSTDFASIPRALWSIYPPFGKYGEPAVVHDFLYRTQCVTRDVADKVFLEAMKAAGVRLTQRWAIYSAVRCFGWAAWNSNKRKGL